MARLHLKSVRLLASFGARHMALAVPTFVLVRLHVTCVRRRAWFGKSNQEKFESSSAFLILPRLSQATWRNARDTPIGSAMVD